MDKILIVGENNFLKGHLEHFLQFYPIKTTTTSKPPKDNTYLLNDYNKEDQYEAIVFIDDFFAEEQTVKNTDDIFNNHIKQLHDALLIPSKYFIYLDYSYGSYYQRPLYQTFCKMARNMIKEYHRFIHRSYNILYIYDLVGYKFNSWNHENHINHLLEKRHMIIKHDYRYIHCVYTMDVIDAIITILDSIDGDDPKYRNTEEHLRYDSIGADIYDIYDLFCKEYPFEHVYSLIEVEDRMAPFDGLPSSLLSDKTKNPFLWIAIKEDQKYY